VLHSFFCTTEFKRAAQSGFYIDFFLKNVFESIVRNVLIYSAQFFCEKYIIEFFTKKIFVNITYYINIISKTTTFDYKTFFIQVLTVVFYIGAFINIILIFFF
jgi:hypothetical protein